jgi:hypothetical protein
MKTTMFALALALSFGAAAVPAFADSGDNPDRTATANSLPQGFYHGTPAAKEDQILAQHFAKQGETSSAVQRDLSAAPTQAHG